MSFKRTVTTLLVALVSASGCATYTLKDVVGALQRNLAEAGVVSGASAISQNSAEYGAFYTAVRTNQCIFHTANPPMAMIAPNVSVAVAGTMTYTGQASGAFPAGAGLQFTVQTSKTQTLTLPLNFVSLQGLPDAYFGQRAQYLTSLPGKDEQSGVKAKALNDLNYQRYYMSYVIMPLINSYSSVNCKDYVPSDKNAGPIVYPSTVRVE